MFHVGITPLDGAQTFTHLRGGKTIELIIALLTAATSRAVATTTVADVFAAVRQAAARRVGSSWHNFFDEYKFQTNASCTTPHAAACVLQIL